MNATVPRNASTSQKGDFILSKLRTPPFLDYLYSKNEFMLSQVNQRISEQVVASSIERYIN
jgi:hypothetical protein